MTELIIIDNKGTIERLFIGGFTMDWKKLVEILDKHVDQKGLAKDVALEVLKPIIEKFVADTANPYDDMLVKYFVEFVEKQ